MYPQVQNRMQGLSWSTLASPSIPIVIASSSLLVIANTVMQHYLSIATHVISQACQGRLIGPWPAARLPSTHRPFKSQATLSVQIFPDYGLYSGLPSSLTGLTFGHTDEPLPQDSLPTRLVGVWSISSLVTNSYQWSYQVLGKIATRHKLQLSSCYYGFQNTISGTWTSYRFKWRRVKNVCEKW